MTVRNVLLTALFVAAGPTIAGAQATDPHQHQPQRTQPGVPPGMPRRPMMMGDMNPMSRMMMLGQMNHGHSDMPMDGGIRHVEGNIAFLKAELKITDAQQKPWDQFAETLRLNAKQLNEMRGAMIQNMAASLTLAVGLERQEKILTARLEAVKRSRAALAGLVPVLNDDQKKMLDELMPHAPAQRK